jgi:hypothetical protein
MAQMLRSIGWPAALVPELCRLQKPFLAQVAEA